MPSKGSRVFSGRGDDGFTHLWGGSSRVPKYAPQPEAYGTLDEANAAIGVARASGCHPETAANLRTVQQDLIQAMGDLARDESATGQEEPLLPHRRVQWLEQQIQALEAHVRPFRGFVLPGQSLPGAFLHQARAVVRRSERAVARMVHQGWDRNPALLPYLNRLSSYLFILALWEDQQAAHRAPGAPKEA